MTGVWDLAHWFLLALVAASVLRSAPAWRSFLNWVLAVSLLLSLLALAQAYGFSPLWYIAGRCRIDATLGNPSYLAAILVVAVLLAAGFLARSFVPREAPSRPAPGSPRTPVPRPGSIVLARLFWGATAVLGLWVLFLTGTRGAFLGLLGGALAAPMAAWVWGDRRALRPLALASGGVLLLTGAIFSFDLAIGIPVAPACQVETVPSRLASTFELAITGSSEAPVVSEGVGVLRRALGIRYAYAAAGLRAFADRPLLGWGTTNFARVFDRFADFSIYQWGRNPTNQAHNKIVEEMATKGALGTAAYLLLWAAAVWGVVHRRRAPREEVLAYAVLGGLAGYFLQNLFLFDSPSMLLQWSLLLGWVAAQERAPGPAPAQRPAVPGSGAEATAGRPSSSMSGPRWLLFLHGLGAAVILAAVGLAVQFNYRPYRAAQLLSDAMAGGAGVAMRLDLAQRTIAAFPPLANDARQNFVQQMDLEWGKFGLADKRLVFAFVEREGPLAFASDPNDARLLAIFLFIPVVATETPEDRQKLEPLLRRLRELAPERHQTYQFLAVQELQKGNHSEAIRIAREFSARAPGTESLFQAIIDLAEAGLAGSQAGQAGP